MGHLMPSSMSDWRRHLVAARFRDRTGEDGSATERMGEDRIFKVHYMHTEFPSSDSVRDESRGSIQGGERNGWEGIGREWMGVDGIPMVHFMHEPRERNVMDTSEESTGVNIYPLDVSTLKKGDYLSPDFCETRVKCRDRKNKAYSLQLNALRDWIERARESIGRPIVVKCDHDGIRVLDDEDAATYTSQQFASALRRAGRAHRKSLHVDVGRLCPETRRKHERNVEIQGKQIQAVAMVTVQYKLTPHARRTPGLPRPPKTAIPAT